MAILKGFAEIPALIDNNAGVISPIGELSKDSATFVRDILIFTNPTYPGVAYLNMQSLNDALVETPPTEGQTNLMLSMIAWVNAKARTGEITSNAQSFMTLFEDTYADQFVLLSSGQTNLAGGYWYPRSLSFRPIANPLDNYIIWFSDNAFNSEFDDTLLYVVTPIEDLDAFFGTQQAVSALLAQNSPDVINNRVRAIRGESPYTVLSVSPFTWHYRASPSITLPTFWSVVIYGRAGDNPDRIKEALQQYILANSTRGVSEWAVVFPDIFRSTEMIITPSWFIQGVPDKQFERGVYSGINSIKDVTNLAYSTCKGPGYDDDYISGNISIIPTLYRGVEATVVMGPENRAGTQYFRDVYSDYLNVPSTSIDFGLMNEVTREFVLTLTDMLEKAEDLTPASIVPSGYTRLSRNGVWYLARTYNQILMLAVSKHSVEELATTLGLPTDITES